MPFGPPATTRELRIGLGMKAQADIRTPNVTAEMLNLLKLNPEPARNPVGIEDDAAEIGKGTDFAINTYLTAWDTQFPINYFTSSEFLAWALAMACGSSVVVAGAGAGSFVHTIVPSNVVNGIELPYFSMAEQIRASPNTVLDRILIGNCVNTVRLTLTAGPTRAASQMTVECIGSGISVSPAPTINAIPASLTTVNLLRSASLTCTLNGVDYVTTPLIDKLELVYSNNINANSRFFPGSGLAANGAALGGRVERGDRMISLTATARFVNGSTELAMLANQTEDAGGAVITLKGGLIAGSTYHGAVLNFSRVRVSAAELGSGDGNIEVVNISYNTLYRQSDNTVFSAVVTNTLPKVGNEA